VLLVVAVVVGGVLIGLARGGSLKNLAEARFRWWPLAIAGLVLQLVPVPSRPGQADHWLAVGLLVASYVVLLGFVVANLRSPGFPLIALGFALNVLVIAWNGGMPVDDQALHRAAGSRYEHALRRLVEGGGLKHHLARPDDALRPLSDVVGIGEPIGNVYSPGDLLAYAGVGWALAELTRRPLGRHRRGSREERSPGQAMPGRRSAAGPPDPNQVGLRPADPGPGSPVVG
jgi:hypothetical protein